MIQLLFWFHSNWSLSVKALRDMTQHAQIFSVLILQKAKITSGESIAFIVLVSSEVSRFISPVYLDLYVGDRLNKACRVLFRFV